MQARFVTACDDATQFPSTPQHEIAFIGRSNCGKSSLINALAQHKKLARTSSMPGRTQGIVFFEVQIGQHNPLVLVDLPGYGYARVGRTTQQRWAALTGAYIDQRQQLRSVVLLLDARRPAQSEERNIVSWVNQRAEVSLIVALTKADKLNKHQCFAAQRSSQQSLDLPAVPALLSVQRRETVDTLRTSLVRLANTW